MAAVSVAAGLLLLIVLLLVLFLFHRYWSDTSKERLKPLVQSG